MSEFYYNDPFNGGKRRIEAAEGSRYVVRRQRPGGPLEALECFADHDAARELVVGELERAARNVDKLGYGEDVRVTHMNLKPMPVFDA